MSDDVASPRRSRGRPPGSGIDDAARLAAVADLLLANPALKPTTAMKRVVRKIEDSDLRRLQVKWKADGPRLQLEAEARARKRAQQAETRRRAEAEALSAGAASFWATTTMMGLPEPAWMRASRELAASPSMRCMQTLKDPAYLGSARQMIDALVLNASPTSRFMQSIEKSPGRQALDALQESSCMQRLSGFQKLLERLDPSKRGR